MIKKKIKFVLDNDRINRSHYAFKISDENIRVCLTNFSLIYKANKDDKDLEYMELSVYISSYGYYDFDEIKNKFLEFMNIDSKNVIDTNNGNQFWKFYKIKKYDWNSHKHITEPIIEHNRLIELAFLLERYSTEDLRKLIAYRLKNE